MATSFTKNKVPAITVINASGLTTMHYLLHVPTLLLLIIIIFFLSFASHKCQTLCYGKSFIYLLIVNLLLLNLASSLIYLFIFYSRAWLYSNESDWLAEITIYFILFLFGLLRSLGKKRAVIKFWVTFTFLLFIWQSIIVNLSDGRNVYLFVCRFCFIVFFFKGRLFLTKRKKKLKRKS